MSQPVSSSSSQQQQPSLKQVLAKTNLEAVSFIQVADRTLFVKVRSLRASDEYALVYLDEDIPIFANEPDWDVITDPREFEIMNDRHPLDPSLRIGLMATIDRSMMGIAVETLGEIRMLGFDYGTEFKVPGTFRIYERYFRQRYFEPPASVMTSVASKIAATSNQPLEAYIGNNTQQQQQQQLSMASTTVLLIIRLSDIIAKPTEMTTIIDQQRERVKSRLRQLALLNADRLLTVQHRTADLTNRVAEDINRIILAVEGNGTPEHYIETMRMIVLLRNELVMTAKHLGAVLSRIEETIDVKI
jgi:hypothetical protein